MRRRHDKAYLIFGGESSRQLMEVGGMGAQFHKMLLFILTGLLLPAVLSGCVDNSPFDYSTEDVRAYLAETSPGQGAEIQSGSRISREWDCSFSNLPDVVFQVRTVRSSSPGPIPIAHYRLSHNADQVLCQYWAVLYQSEGGELSLWAEALENPETPLEITYQSRDEAEAAVAQFTAFQEWAAQQPHGSLLGATVSTTPLYLFQPDDSALAAAVNALTNNPGQVRVWQWPEAPAEEVLAACEQSLLEFGTFLNLQDTSFSKDELTAYVQERWDWTDERMVRQSPAGFYRAGEEISRSTFSGIGYDVMAGGAVVSYGGLYELLVRLEAAPEGTPEHFSFTGADGRRYEFSYGFLEETWEESDYTSWVTRTWYYLVDDARSTLPGLEKKPLIALKSEAFTDMTGLSLPEYTPGQEPEPPKPGVYHQEDGTTVIRGGGERQS